MVCFCLFDLEIDFLNLKITLSHKKNKGNGLPSQNHMEMRYYACSWLHLLNKYIWPWHIWRPFCFWPLKIPPKGAKVAPSWYQLRTSPRIRINHKTSSIPRNKLELQNVIWQLHYYTDTGEWVNEHIFIRINITVIHSVFCVYQISIRFQTFFYHSHNQL